MEKTRYEVFSLRLQRAGLFPNPALLRMNVLKIQRRRSPQPASDAAGAFTLTELLFTVALLSLVFAAVFTCQYYGMQLHNFIRPKLENAAFARETLAHLVEEVRCADSIEIGQGTMATFTAAGTTNAQSGNAVRIRLAGNTNQFIYYFRDTGTETLMKSGLGASNAVVVAREVTNSVVFRLENFRGVVQTNTQNQTVVDVLLQMRQPAFRQNVADSYQVRTKITRRIFL
jgi:hypothetical protein